MTIMTQFDRKPRQKKSLGQVFLRHKHTIENVLKAMHLAPEDVVLEIGGGDGRVSEELVNRVERLLIVEIDPRYVTVLLKRFENDPRVSIIRDDILSEQTMSGLMSYFDGRLLKVYGSIPYYITTPILNWLLKNRKIFSTATILMQKEVARRVVASHGNKEYGYLSVIMQLNSHVSLGPMVSRKNFSPVPNVDSQVLHIDLDVKPRAGRQFEQMVSSLFQQRRKQIGNSLKGFLNEQQLESFKGKFPDSKKYLTARPEQFSPEELLHLYEMLIAL